MTELDTHAVDPAAGTNRHRAGRRSRYTLAEREAHERAVLDVVAALCAAVGDGHRRRRGARMGAIRRALPELSANRVYRTVERLARRGALAWGLGPKGHTKHYRVAS